MEAQILIALLKMFRILNTACKIYGITGDFKWVFSKQHAAVSNENKTRKYSA